MARADQLKIRYRRLADLVPYERNARTHPAAQIVKLRASLGEFGWTNPILTADGTVIAGHGRLAAALEMQRDGQPIPRQANPALAPTIDLSHLSPEQRRSYILADNRIAMDSGWDEELLRAELAELSVSSLALELTGFDSKEMRDIFFPMEKETTRSGRRGIGDSLTYQIVLDCANEVHQTALLDELKQRGLKCRPLIL